MGEDTPWAGAAHRVRLYVEDSNAGDGPGLYVAAWQTVGQAEDFDPDEDVEPLLLSDRVVGLDCRMQDPQKAIEPDEPFEWIDEWTASTATSPSCALRSASKSGSSRTQGVQ